MQHLHVSDLLNSQFIVAQPQNFSDPLAQSAGYCAWHDYTEPGIENGIYNGVTPNISFTNMPYVLNQSTSCGENSVNAGAAGKLDGATIVLGHEIEETVTDPGAEDPAPNGKSLGAWYDVNQVRERRQVRVGRNRPGLADHGLRARAGPRSSRQRRQHRRQQQRNPRSELPNTVAVEQ